MADAKTELPTPKKLLKARERGEVAKSRDVASTAVLLAAVAVMAQVGWWTLELLLRELRVALSLTHMNQPELALRESGWTFATALAPLLFVAAAVGAAVTYVQVGPVFAIERITPRLNRLNPAEGMKRILSRRSMVQLGKTLVVVAVVGVVVWVVVRSHVREITTLSQHSHTVIFSVFAAILGQVFWRVALVLVVVAAFDLIYQRWQFLQDQRMTKNEVKREYKESEGDPVTKQERQRLHRELLDYASIEQVRKADVLVVNPTHYAIAIKYDRNHDDHAPEVVAKGQEYLAKRMIEVAQEAGVPIMRDVPLAHALYMLQEGDHIPEALYEAVAAVLHAAWNESGRGPEVEAEERPRELAAKLVTGPRE